MNLSAMSSELQSLVIASCLDYVLSNLKDVVVIIPEAWEFIPRGRKSPVTLSAEAYVRKGATLGNFLWIDSQDLAGVHTPILKQTHVFLLGVQREINEIKRTIAHLHGPAKPKPDEIAQLGLGQFIACYGSTAVTTYVQPWWMSEAAARASAMGSTQHAVQEAAKHYKPTPVGRPLPPLPSTAQAIITDIEDPMDAELRRENERLTVENADLRTRIGRLEDARNSALEHAPGDATDWYLPSPSATRLMEESTRPGPVSTIDVSTIAGPAEIDALYATIRNRLLNDVPVLQRIQQLAPEIVVELTPRVITIEGSSPRGRLARVVAQGFCNAGKKNGEIREEINRSGSEIVSSRMSEYLDEFVTQGYLCRTEGGRYQKAPGLKVSTRELTAV